MTILGNLNIPRTYPMTILGDIQQTRTRVKRD